MNFGLNLRLVDALQVILNGILQAHDVALVVVEHLEHCVKCCGFSGARRTRNQNHAKRPFERLLDIRQIYSLNAKLFKRVYAYIRIQNTKRDLFAVVSWKC